ncbi:hypothetical protein [Actinophytocola oryzae]|uniref:Uncharacterized protein n=1 Tax=Actinophytocola oryzae TaxID=502181 RepID=A0A4R7VD59_9PSEU|nr:hypothetical protein [Actinophytocola oryzae]TDV46918.1 hypothetical protein CLV71_110101 [Actinophytocola oryzae]
MESSRLLRRGLLVAAVASAGWLLSVVFAGVASAEEAQADQTVDEPQAQTLRDPSGGLLGDLLGGLTDTLGGVADKVGDFTGSLVDTSADFLSPSLTAPQGHAPILDVPSLPSSGSAADGSTTDESDGSLPRVDVVTTTAPAAPPELPPPPLLVIPDAQPFPVTQPAVAQAAAPGPAAQHTASEQAGSGDHEPAPVKTPAAPCGTGTAVSASHDNPGNARGTHGVLPTQDTLHPADAGFTTRGLAGGAAGRVAGLPASSPD